MIDHRLTVLTVDQIYLCFRKEKWHENWTPTNPEPLFTTGHSQLMEITE